MNIEFEWDENKNVLNQINHHVSFEEATLVFSAPDSIERYDWDHSLLEDRWLIYGMIGLDVLIVSFTERDGIIRIISARKAEKKEEEEYFKWVW